MTNSVLLSIGLPSSESVRRGMILKCKATYPNPELKKALSAEEKARQAKEYHRKYMKDKREAAKIAKQLTQKP